MNPRHVIVVGAGAAGLTAAIRAAEAGARVTLLNAHPRIGLKILMSGGTRCNVTHREVSERDFNGGSRHVIARILRAFTPEQTRAWFDSLGVTLKLEDTGKYFPESDDAETVLAALLGACERAGVEVRAGAQAIRIERTPGADIDVSAGRSIPEQAGAARASGAAETRVGADSRESGATAAPRFRLGIRRVSDSAALGARVAELGRTAWPLPAEAPDEWLEADAVILATGGLSFPRTGSDGTGYALVTALGHTLVPPVPALTPLTSDDPWCVMLQGLTCDVELTLRVAGKVAAHTRGSMLWAHFGYSGPAALDLSRHWLRAQGGGAWAVSLNVAPDRTRETLEAGWLAAARDTKLTVRRHLGAWLPDRLAVTLAAEAGVGPALRIAQVPRERRRALIELLVARQLRITGTLGYEKAEVTAGGVPLEEVDPSTLESRRAPGVYLCGEILDVEGRLGGFNFQWSWSSGTVAGRASAGLAG